MRECICKTSDKEMILSLQTIQTEPDDEVTRGLGITIITTVRTLMSTISNNCSGISIVCSVNS